MILPRGAVPDIAQAGAMQPSRTYRIDFENGRFRGMVDGLDAVRQTVMLILNTPRYLHFIHSGNFGIERSQGNFANEMQQHIADALLQDERITGVEDFKMTVSGDDAQVSFTVVTVFGTIPMERSFA